MTLLHYPNACFCTVPYLAGILKSLTQSGSSRITAAIPQVSTYFYPLVYPSLHMYVIFSRPYPNHYFGLSSLLSSRRCSSHASSRPKVPSPSVFRAGSLRGLVFFSRDGFPIHFRFLWYIKWRSTLTHRTRIELAVKLGTYMCGLRHAESILRHSPISSNNIDETGRML